MCESCNIRIFGETAHRSPFAERSRTVSGGVEPRPYEISFKKEMASHNRYKTKINPHALDNIR